MGGSDINPLINSIPSIVLFEFESTLNVKNIMAISAQKYLCKGWKKSLPVLQQFCTVGVKYLTLDIRCFAKYIDNIFDFQHSCLLGGLSLKDHCCSNV